VPRVRLLALPVRRVRGDAVTADARAAAAAAAEKAAADRAAADAALRALQAALNGASK
jgi:hypothetical protein